MEMAGSSEPKRAPEMATLEIHKGPDAALCVGGLRYVACRREVGGIDGGITLYLWTDADPAVELIRMDLFRQRPHYHAPAENRSETRIERGERDIVDWGVEAVTRRAAALAEEAGFPEIAAGLDGPAIEAAAGDLTRLLRGLDAPNEVSYFELPRAVLEELDAAEDAQAAPR